MKKQIAIIGGGIAGLTAAYLLQRKYDVTLFERSGRLGGNAYTLTTPSGDEVDIAAAVFGRHSCKNLFRLFRELGIETVRAVGIGPLGLTGPGVSYYDLDSKEGLYFTPRLSGLAAQRFAVLHPRRVAAVLRLMAGLRRARALARDGSLDGLTVRQALELVPALAGAARLMFLGSLCLLTSMHGRDVLAAPARFLVELLAAHDDLIPPTPRTLSGASFVKRGTRAYVAALAEPCRDRVVLNAAISTVRRGADHVLLVMEDGGRLRFDRAVLACNADQALALLEDPTAEERRLLGALEVHRGHRRRPRRPRTVPPAEPHRGVHFPLPQDRPRHRDVGQRLPVGVARRPPELPADQHAASERPDRGGPPGLRAGLPDAALRSVLLRRRPLPAVPQRRAQHLFLRKPLRLRPARGRRHVGRQRRPRAGRGALTAAGRGPSPSRTD